MRETETHFKDDDRTANSLVKLSARKE